MLSDLHRARIKVEARGIIKTNKRESLSEYYGCRSLGLYLDISGFITAFSVCLIGLFFYFPHCKFEYILRGAEIVGIFFAGMAIVLILTNTIKTNNNMNFIRDNKIIFYLKNLPLLKYLNTLLSAGFSIVHTYKK